MGFSRIADVEVLVAAAVERVGPVVGSRGQGGRVEHRCRARAFIDTDQIDDIMAGRTPRPPRDWDDEEESGSGGAEATADTKSSDGSTGDHHIGGPAGEH